MSHQHNSDTMSNDIELIKHSMSVLQENVSENAIKISKIQTDISNILQEVCTKQDVLEVCTKQDVLDLKQEIAKMQRGLSFIYGKDNFQKNRGADLN